MDIQTLPYWREIPDYEIYKISRKGEIISFSIDKKKGRKIRNHKRKDGYLVVNLWRNKQGKSFLVHRLVANAFIPPESGKEIVNHKDNNRQNCSAENLEWCTPKENLAHAEKIGACDFNRKMVAQYTMNGNLIKIWESATSADRFLEPISDTRHRNSKISQCGKGIRKTAYGYRWKYLTKFSIDTGIVPPIINWRLGQTIFNMLEWMLQNGHAPANQAERLADTFHLSDEKIDALYREFLSFYNPIR